MRCIFVLSLATSFNGYDKSPSTQGIDDGEGHLVTPVGLSPENYFIANNKKSAPLSMGTTMDMAIIRETFERTIQASEMFDVDRELRAELKEKLPLLLPFRIGARGQLQEWMYNFEEREPQHRHFSHLYGFHPGDQINHKETPELFKAVAKTLELRGDGASGWSMGWKINCWARLLDGDHAFWIYSRTCRNVVAKSYGIYTPSACIAQRLARRKGERIKSKGQF